ncbi:MAG: hypothetical protein LBF51_01470 [Zoogloeaceae bacterium]|jgi:hypothetical protein|nr:hypothetical protein [Zoogloeaceae bacterium]
MNDAIDQGALNACLAAYGLSALRQSHPRLFAAAPVFVAAEEAEAIVRLVTAIETTVALPSYRDAVLARAPEIARRDPGYPAVCMGYDFHLTPTGPKLIEINTNAGGLLLNALLARSQGEDGGEAELEALAMFRAVWGKQTPRRLAIVDDDPARQYLAPEFHLFRRLFAAAGIDARIAAPAELTWDGQHLRHARGIVDVVYNRLTDFALAASEHAALAAAYRENAVILTPHPYAHALYADKRNFCLLSDPEWLAQSGLAAGLRQTLLAGVPHTREVRPEDAESVWQTRKRRFFKPASGFGGRAAYRGDKLTHRVFGEILQGRYVTQDFVAPATRRFTPPGADAAREWKFDLRAYAFQGHVQFLAARLYQGQITNMRTPGGGFALVRKTKGRELARAVIGTCSS